MTALRKVRFLPPGVIGALVLVVMVESRIERHATLPLLSATWRASRDALRHQAAGSQVLVLGDSLSKHGVLPNVLEKRLGVRAFNVALPGGRIPVSYALFRRCLLAGNRPKMVILDGELLPSSPLELIQPWIALLDPAELLELAWVTADGRRGGRLLTEAILPSLRNRSDIREAVLGRSRDESRTLAIYQRNWRRNRGAQVLPAGSTAEVAAPKVQGVGSVYCNPANAWYLGKLLSLAARHDVQVVWLLTPLHPLHQDARDRTRWTATYRGWLKRLQTQYSNLLVVDAQSAGYPPEAMADATHLNRRGAACFSGELAEALRPWLQSPIEQGSRSRWTTLPAYRESAERVAIEDVAQSEAVLMLAEEPGLPDRVRR